MLDALSFAADLALFVLTVFVVGKKPTAPKVTAMICLVLAIDYGFIALVAMQAQQNPVEWYRELLEEAMGAYAALGVQAQDYEATISAVAGISPAIYVVQSTTYVFVGLAIRWVADRVRHRSEWSPFSEVDLSIWWLVPLLLGISGYTVSLFLPSAVSHTVWLFAMNVLVVSAVPLFVQGAAAGKGIMNRFGLSAAWQTAIGVLVLFSGVALLMMPLMGLVDFWANFRRLNRGHADEARTYM